LRSSVRSEVMFCDIHRDGFGDNFILQVL